MRLLLLSITMPRTAAATRRFTRIKLIGYAKSTDAAHSCPTLLNSEETAICAAATHARRIIGTPWIRVVGQCVGSTTGTIAKAAITLVVKRIGELPWLLKITPGSEDPFISESATPSGGSFFRLRLNDWRQAQSRGLAFASRSVSALPSKAVDCPLHGALLAQGGATALITFQRFPASPDTSMRQGGDTRVAAPPRIS